MDVQMESNPIHPGWGILESLKDTSYKRPVVELLWIFFGSYEMHMFLIHENFLTKFCITILSILGDQKVFPPDEMEPQFDPMTIRYIYQTIL